ncbi:hypothetical protein ACVWYH_004327 [Bradyrhizobium sp. GM24.11]
MRPPFSEMLPESRGVSIFTRGLAAIAVSRLTVGWACWFAPGAVVGAGALPACGVAPGVADAVGCGLVFWSSACVCCWARCFSIAGTL